MSRLGALLLNPPMTAGTRTIRHLKIVATLLGCDDLEIANLFAFPTRDVTAINEVGQACNGWAAARLQLGKVIADADCLLAGWGVSGLSGPALAHQSAQLLYVARCAREAGMSSIWTLNGEPRHPSRWHQYVSDRHGRARGNSLNERLGMVLKSVPIGALVPRPLNIDGEAEFDSSLDKEA